MVKAVIPYVILSVSLATLNTRLHLPPFSILLVALALTDGAYIYDLHRFAVIHSFESGHLDILLSSFGRR